MRFDVVTIFPAMFGSVFEQGVVGRAIEHGVIQLRAHDLRDFTHDRHRQVDDMPFGGGPGMVMKVAPTIVSLACVVLPFEGRIRPSTVAERALDSKR